MNRIKLNFYERERPTDRDRERETKICTDTCSPKPCENEDWGSESYLDKPRNTETGKVNEEILPAFSRAPFLFCKMRGLL